MESSLTKLHACASTGGGPHTPASLLRFGRTLRVTWGCESGPEWQALARPPGSYNWIQCTSDNTLSTSVCKNGKNDQNCCALKVNLQNLLNPVQFLVLDWGMSHLHSRVRMTIGHTPGLLTLDLQPPQPSTRQNLEISSLGGNCMLTLLPYRVCSL